MKKSPWLFGMMIFCWVCAALYLSPRLLALLIGPENIIAKLAVIFFTLSLNLFWFYGFYHLVIILFSYNKRNTALSWPKNYSLPASKPKVALLYTTCNDFREEAVITCLRQDYAASLTFILDDSDEETFKKRVDEFAARHADKVRVIRRPNRRGYKAGNLNHALRHISGFEYFSISDADTVLPRDYITKLLPYFSRPDIAFVQARQELNPQQKEAFARELGYQIGFHCDRYLSVKNKYGFVMFYGHSALMRVDVCKEVGGFPEVATEDLAYSLVAGERGYQGIYAGEVTCYEDYPSTYRQYRRRNEKWIRGTTECLFKFYASFVRNPRISRIEKVDVFASAMSLLLAVPFSLLLFLVGIVLPFYFYHFRFQGPMFRLPLIYEHSFLDIALKTSGNLFWRWDFFLMLLISVLGPVIPLLVEMPRAWRKYLRSLLMYTVMFYATQVVSSLNLLAYFVSRQAPFPVTGQQRETIIKRTFRERLGTSCANHSFVIAIEVLSAAVFFIICLFTDNLWFISFAAGMVLSVALFRLPCEHKLIRAGTVIPLLILIIIVFLIGRNIQ